MTSTSRSRALHLFLEPGSTFHHSRENLLLTDGFSRRYPRREDEDEDEDEEEGDDAGHDEDFSMAFLHKSTSWVPTGESSSSLLPSIPRHADILASRLQHP